MIDGLVITMDLIILALDFGTYVRGKLQVSNEDLCYSKLFDVVLKKIKDLGIIW